MLSKVPSQARNHALALGSQGSDGIRPACAPLMSRSRLYKPRPSICERRSRDRITRCDVMIPISSRSRFESTWRYDLFPKPVQHALEVAGIVRLEEGSLARHVQIPQSR